MCLQVLDVLRSLCVGNGVAVRTNQNLICDNLLPGKDLLLQTSLINHVSRYSFVLSQNMFISRPNDRILIGYNNS